MLVKSRKSCSMMSALPGTAQARDYTLLSYRRVAQFLFYSSLGLYFRVSPGPCPSQALQTDPWSAVCGRTRASPPRSSQMLLWLCELCQDRGGGSATSARAALEGTICNRAFGGFTQQPQALWSHHGMLLPGRALPLMAQASARPGNSSPSPSGTARHPPKARMLICRGLGASKHPKLLGGDAASSRE